MKPSIIVWDLETVPDLAGFAAANDLVGKPEADIREALGNRFPKHIYHTIVCIGPHRESDHWAVDPSRWPGVQPGSRHLPLNLEATNDAVLFLNCVVACLSRGGKCDT
jgi:hypothetical protein